MITYEEREKPLSFDDLLDMPDDVRDAILRYESGDDA
jgi:hypothetical protein